MSRKRKLDDTRRITAGRGGSGLRREDLSRIQGQSAAVLALLVWAHAQPDRFDAGWVMVGDLTRCTIIGVELPNVRRGLSRALAVLRSVRGLRVESGKRQRRTRLRLCPPVAPALHGWLQEVGRAYLLPSFSEVQLPPLSPSSEIGQLTTHALQEIGVQFAGPEEIERYLDHEVAAVANRPLSSDTWTNRARRLIVATDVLLSTSGIAPVRKLQAALAAHERRLGSDSTHDVLIASGQIAVALSRCAVRASLLSRAAWPLVEVQAADCAEALRRAAPCIPDLPYQERGDAALAEAALSLHEASSNRLPWTTATETMERHLEKATVCFRLARSTRGLMDVLMFRTEAVLFSWLGQSSGRLAVPRVTSRVAASKSNIPFEVDRSTTELAALSDRIESQESEIVVLSTLIWSSFSSTLPGQSDYWVIARSRWALFSTCTAVRDFRTDHRARTANKLVKIRNELHVLERLASPASRPYVDHARGVLEDESAALAIDLCAIAADMKKSGSDNAEPDRALQLGVQAVKRDRKLRATSQT